MPSPLHEALLQLFRNRPELAPELLRAAAGLELPAYREARIDSSDLSQAKPVEYRADAVINLVDGKAVLGIVVEVQLSVDERKRYTWPAYVTNLRARLECPVRLLVVTSRDDVARWAARPIDLGGGSSFSPIVVGPNEVPEITDLFEAESDPELAVLSVIAHGRDPDEAKSTRIALTALDATAHLDEERALLYFDLIWASSSEPARRELIKMKPAGYEFQSDFLRNAFAQGKDEGRAEGRVAVLVRLLTLRFGPLTEEVQGRIARLSVAELDVVAERLLSASTLDEALNTHWRA
jgi:hypothetical protein